MLTESPLVRDQWETRGTTWRKGYGERKEMGTKVLMTGITPDFHTQLLGEMLGPYSQVRELRDPREGWEQNFIRLRCPYSLT